MAKSNDTRFNISWVTNVAAAAVYYVMLNVEIYRSNENRASLYSVEQAIATFVAQPMFNRVSFAQVQLKNK